MTAREWIEQLNLEEHPEGGYFRETYRSDITVTTHQGRERSAMTSIYFLLRASSPSHFHRLAHDEVWYYQAGSGLTVHILDPMKEGGNTGAEYRSIRLGPDIAKGEEMQGVVPAGCWFGATVNQGEGPRVERSQEEEGADASILSPDESDSYALVGCAVAPGFDFDDFELGEREVLLKEFPEQKKIILGLTRERSGE